MNTASYVKPVCTLSLAGSEDHIAANTQTAVYAGRSTAMTGSLHPIGLRFVQDRETFHEGGDAGVFFTVVSGLVRTCKFRGDGQRQIDGFHGLGDVFGFDASQKRSLSAEAVCDCTVAPQRWRGMAAGYDGVPHHLFLHAMRSLARPRTGPRFPAPSSDGQRSRSCRARQMRQSPSPTTREGQWRRRSSRCPWVKVASATLRTQPHAPAP